MKKITFAMIAFLVFKFGNAQNTCAGAISVASGSTTSVGTINGSKDNTCAWGTAATFGEWYIYNSSIEGVVTISSDLSQNDGITNSDDTRVSVYTGSCGVFTCHAASDDVNGSNYLTTLTFVVRTGVSYYILWDDRWSNLGFDFTLTEELVTCTSGPYTPPYSEDFSNINEVPVCWNLIDADGDGFNWEVIDYDIDDDGSLDGNPTLASYSYDNDSNTPLTPDNWIITEAIDLTNATAGSPTLTWKARGLDIDFADENYTVYAATGNEIADFLASSVTFNEIIGQNGGAGVTFVNRSLDISAFAGQMVYIAFRHHNVSDEFVLNIDDLAVTATLGLDEFNNNVFKHYYNKDTDVLTLDSSNLPLDNIEMFNVLGQEVLRKGLSDTIESISLAEMQDGVYIAKVTIEGQVQTVKLLKQ